MSETVKLPKGTYICGICEEQCSFEEISEHHCCKGFASTVFDSKYIRFYPSKTCLSDLEVQDKVFETDIVNEDLSSNSQQTNKFVWSDKLTEQLIAEVHSREPLWNLDNYSADDSQLKNDRLEFDKEENNDESASCVSKTNKKKRKHEDALSKIAVSVCKPSQLIVLPLQPQPPLPTPSDEIKSFALLVENRLRQMDDDRRSDSIKKIITILYH